MKIDCTVEILNRIAHANGQNGKIKPSKCVIQFKSSDNNNGRESSSSFLISTNKNVNGQWYEVRKIGKIRSNFISEGKLTIEMDEPKMNLMIRNGKANELKLFLDEIQKAKAESKNKRQQETNDNNNSINSNPPQKKIKLMEDSKSKSNNNSSTNNDLSTESKNNVPAPSPSDSSVVEPLAEAEPNKMEYSRKIPKKKRKDEEEMKVMTKKELSAMKKRLKANTTGLVVSQRENYPLKGFGKDLREIVIRGLSLKKIDPNILPLKHLTSLNLSKNRISVLDDLAKLQCQLNYLDLSSNIIENVPESLFFSASFSKLKILNMSNNLIRYMPLSLLNLEELNSLILSHNQLHSLPYNMFKLKNLRVLHVNDNDLAYLPATINILKLNVFNPSENPFYSKQKLVRNYQPGNVSTLMKLTASFIMTYNMKSPTKQIKMAREELPSLVNDYLDHCIYCIRCGHMSLTYSTRMIYVIPSADEIISSRGRGANQMLSKMVYCRSCSQQVKY